MNSELLRLLELRRRFSEYADLSIDMLHEIEVEMVELSKALPKVYGRCKKELIIYYSYDFPLVNSITINVGDLVYFQGYPVVDFLKYTLPGSYEEIRIPMSEEHFEFFETFEKLECQFQ